METVLPQFVIIDLGSQYSHVIRRTLQELGFRSVLLTPERAATLLPEHRPRGIIWSGGSACVGEVGAPVPPKNYLGEVPTLGICLGMQYLAAWLGGTLTKTVERKEYGPRPLWIRTDSSLLFRGLYGSDALCSHGDSVAVAPPGFTVTAETVDCPVAAMEDAAAKIYGVQFHPEVATTTHGKVILDNFARLICGAKPDWAPGDRIAAIRAQVAGELLPDARALLLYSGGVDSSVTAKLLAPLLGDRLVGLTVDAGNLRKNELEQILANGRTVGLTNHHVTDVAAPLLLKLQRPLTDAVSGAVMSHNPYRDGLALDERIARAYELGLHAETKRQAFRAVYAAAARDFAVTQGCTHWIQGTLATDQIESGRLGGACTIKSHHNVGLDIGLPALNPLETLFKYEVRALGRALGLPPEVTERMPFPGPGLLVRLIGAPVSEALLERLREVDAVAQEVVDRSGWFNLDHMDQMVVALCGAKTVGVKGDEREYGYPVVIRAVRTDDFMTAKAVTLPETLRRQLIEKLTQIPEITRVWFDETPKPPATVELE